MIIKALKTEHGYLAALPYGEWMVDGSPIAIDRTGTEVNFTDPNICKIATYTLTTHYVDAAGNKLPTTEYEGRAIELQKNKRWSECGEQHIFDNLEEEFEYRKFTAQWSPATKQVTTISDPVPVQVAVVKVDTGNEFIQPVMSTKNIDNGLYVYHRADAIRKLIKAKFESLGMEYQPEVSYRNTEGKKVWGTSYNNTNISSFVAFGTYPFTEDKYKNIITMRGTLEQLEVEYRNDAADINVLIQVRHDLHFETVNLDLEKLYKSIKQLGLDVAKLPVKQKGLHSVNNIVDRIENITESLDEEITNATR